MKRLLIVGDDLALAAILKRRMQRHDFECCHAEDASQALLSARSWQPSHVLLDMKLAQSNGLSLIVPLRASLPKACIVLLTGFASIATAVEAVKLGADNYLKGEPKSHTASSLPDETPLHPKRLEWEHIQQVLNANKGNVSATARQLGMHRRTLQRKLAKKPVA